MESTVTTTIVRDEVSEIRSYIEGFLNGGEGSPKVREYLSSVVENDDLLSIYLKGRKYRPKHAWDTLKRKAQVRFDEYPEVFPERLPEFLYPLQKNGVFGMLKGRDNYGNRIGFINAGVWEPNEVSIEEMCGVGTYFLDRLLYDEDVAENGLVFIHNCAGIGLKQAKHYTLPAMLRIMHVFWYSYPVKIKAFYCINVPFYFVYLYKLIKPFFSKKLKQRFILTTTDKQFELLHENMSSKLLPESLGGVLDNEAAIDMDFLKNFNKHLK